MYFILAQIQIFLKAAQTEDGEELGPSLRPLVLYVHDKFHCSLLTMQ